MKSKIHAVLILSLLGLMVSSYLIYQHYKPVGTSICVISEYVNCDIVNKSMYSEIFGIPVAVLGALAYLSLGILGFILKKSPTRRFMQLLTYFAGASLLFSLYLTYVELFVLHAICPFCVTSQIIILIIFIISLFLWKNHSSSK